MHRKFYGRGVLARFHTAIARELHPPSPVPAPQSIVDEKLQQSTNHWDSRLGEDHG